MKRGLAWIIALCLAAALAVPAWAEGTDFYGALLEQTEALAALREEIAGICAGAREELAGFSADYKSALDSLGYYDLGAYRQKLAEREGRMRDCAGQIGDCVQTLAGMTAGDAVQREALDACREYASGVRAVADEFLTVVAFHQAQFTAGDPLNTLSSENAETLESNFAYARAWEKASAEVAENFEALTPPAYLSQAWSSYRHQTRLFSKMCELKREGLGYGDTLRLYSASQLLAREYNLLAKYELTMYDLSQRTFAQEEARLGWLADNAEAELLSACRSRAPSSFAWRQAEPKLTLTYEMADAVYPNLYHSMDSVVNMIAFTDHGTKDLLITAQIGDFTQQYQQMVKVGPELTRLTIKPPVMANLPDMTGARDTQLTLTVTEANTGKLLAQESHPLKLYSLYDFNLFDNEFGFVNYDDILAWTTPESDGVMKVRRQAIAWMDEHNLGLDSLVGYQNSLHVSDDKLYLNTRAQAIALQGAISDLGVRYNMGAFSLNTFQRILMPDAVVENQSGVCVETAVLLASALQSAKMHAMILFIPGHSQVALETWRGSAQYFLLETTMLPFEDSEASFNSFCQLLSQKEWEAYLEDCANRGVAYVVDCNLVNIFDYQGLF